MSRLLGLMVGLVGFVVLTSAQVHQMGTTYASYQHQGSCGRMIGVDDNGFVHVVWTKDITNDHAFQHIFYNVWDEGGLEFQNGILLDDASIANSTTITVAPNHFAFSAFSERHVDNRFHACAALDDSPYEGAFISSYPEPIFEDPVVLAITEPKICRTSNGNLHLVGADMTTPGQIHRIYYAHGLPQFEDGHGTDIIWTTQPGGVEYALIDSAIGLAHTIAASRTGNRVAIAYTRPVAGFANADVVRSRDVFVCISENGGTSWPAPVNITEFLAPDFSCFQTTLDGVCCSKDTLSAGADISLLFDGTNQLHVAFTTYRYRQWDACGHSPDENPFKAIVWHWSEATDEMREIAEAWTADEDIVAGRQLAPNHYMVERPSLAIHPTSGAMYCVYLRYDFSVYSEAGYLNADVFGSIYSTAGGTSWSVGVNLTNSIPVTIPAPAGQNLNEQDVTVSETVQAEALPLSYLMDSDANPDAATPSLNGFFYQSVLTSAIPATPLLTTRAFRILPEECHTMHYADPEECQLALEEDTLEANGQNTTHLLVTVVGFQNDTLGADVQLRINHTGAGSFGNPAFIGQGTFSVLITAPSSEGSDMISVAQLRADCAIDLGAIVIFYGPTQGAADPAALPSQIRLYSSQPNPFNGATTIRFELPQTARVELQVFDVLGRAVDVLENRTLEAGPHQLVWSPHVSSGVYFLRLQAGEKVFSQKLMFLR